MKLPFGRKKQSNDSLPAEIQDYYQSQRREKAGVAWLLAAGVFIVTLLIATALFFGGRWAYRQITDRGNDAPVTGQNEQQTEENGGQGSGEGDVEETPAITPSENDDTSGNGSPESTPPQPQTPAPQPTAPSTSLPDTNGDR